eukprot:gene23441-biopygen8864
MLVCVVSEREGKAQGKKGKENSKGGLQGENCKGETARENGKGKTARGNGKGKTARENGKGETARGKRQGVNCKGETARERGKGKFARGTWQGKTARGERQGENSKGNTTSTSNPVRSAGENGTTTFHANLHESFSTPSFGHNGQMISSTPVLLLRLPLGLGGVLSATDAPHFVQHFKDHLNFARGAGSARLARAMAWTLSAPRGGGGGGGTGVQRTEGGGILNPQAQGRVQFTDRHLLGPNIYLRLAPPPPPRSCKVHESSGIASGLTPVSAPNSGIASGLTPVSAPDGTMGNCSNSRPTPGAEKGVVGAGQRAVERGGALLVGHRGVQRVPHALWAGSKVDFRWGSPEKVENRQNHRGESRTPALPAPEIMQQSAGTTPSHLGETKAGADRTRAARWKFKQNERGPAGKVVPPSGPAPPPRPKVAPATAARRRSHSRSRRGSSSAPYRVRTPPATRGTRGAQGDALNSPNLREDRAGFQRGWGGGGCGVSLVFGDGSGCVGLGNGLGAEWLDDGN